MRRVGVVFYLSDGSRHWVSITDRKELHFEFNAKVLPMIRKHADAGRKLLGVHCDDVMEGITPGTVAVSFPDPFHRLEVPSDLFSGPML